MHLVDSVSREERINPPSRFEIWIERKVLEHDIKTLREKVRDFEREDLALKDLIPEARGKLFKLLDYQRKRGFKHKEELHWALVLVNWQLFAGLMVVSIGIYGLWLGLHL